MFKWSKYYKLKTFSTSSLLNLIFKIGTKFYIVLQFWSFDLWISYSIPFKIVIFFNYHWSIVFILKWYLAAICLNFVQFLYSICIKNWLNLLVRHHKKLWLVKILELGVVWNEIFKVPFFIFWRQILSGIIKINNFLIKMIKDKLGNLIIKL